jgi:hypothetical protein
MTGWYSTKGSEPMTEIVEEKLKLLPDKPGRLYHEE